MKDANSLIESPLSVDEVINCLRNRWGVSYDLQLIVRRKRLFLQIMWAYLEQQSFPLSKNDYVLHLNEVLEIVNRLGFASLVREWIRTVGSKPRLGRALTLPLPSDIRTQEFII